MSKSIWGPIKWKELHVRALSYLSMEGEKAWFESFVRSIPCPKCQKHFESFISQNPFDPKTRIEFFQWTVDAHNFVNRALRKSEITYQEALILHCQQWLTTSELS